jgi:DNA-binding NarL/FixJ family response regulator
VKRVGKPVENDAESEPVREQEILRPLALGYTNREIAEQLRTSVETVAVHRAEAMKNWDYRAASMSFAMQSGKAGWNKPGKY